MRVCEAMLRQFVGVGALDIACADIFSAGPADAIISPANSYGYMDGGIDLVYVQRFGWGLQARLQSAIATLPSRLLPVGYALTVPTGDAEVPQMISAPTMKVPQPVPLTQNAYLAFRAALREARERGFETLLGTGMCTLTGRMDPDESAAQMRRAWAEVIG
jgi:O-acetyl-ADP-ribose deacetylase (regulator of RNase III)